MLWQSNNRLHQRENRDSTQPIAHYSKVKVRNVRFHVNENGRQQVVEQQQKNVHAFVKGYFPEDVDDSLEEIALKLVHISYNPYKAGFFYRKDNVNPVHTADYAVVTVRGVFAKNPQ
mgnify:CR=1 FL=1